MSDNRIEGYARGLFEIARAEGTLDEVEERQIRLVITKIGRNKGEICEALGISRPTLERKLEKYGITFE